jgi:hypothetical protein
MNITFNLGQATDQHIIILQDECGTLEAHTYSLKAQYDAVIELSAEANQKIIFKQEANTV